MENDYSSSRLFISVQLTRFSVAFFLSCYILSFQVATLKQFTLYVTSDHCASRGFCQSMIRPYIVYSSCLISPQCTW